MKSVAESPYGGGDRTRTYQVVRRLIYSPLLPFEIAQVCKQFQPLPMAFGRDATRLRATRRVVSTLPTM